MFEALQPPGWAKPSGYANGIAARGKMIFVAGQIGWNEQCKFESDDLVEQTGQTLKNIAAILRAGVIPPIALICARVKSIRCSDTSGIHSRGLLKSSPIAIGVDVWFRMMRNQSVCSGASGSSRKKSWYGSTALASCTACDG